MTAGAPVSYRDVKIYRPFPADVPACLSRQGCDLDDVRIAKLDPAAAQREGMRLAKDVIGTYWLVRRADNDLYEIKALAVCRRFRRRGIGGWLLGHALGIAETRGGRVVAAPTAAAAFFRKAGFADEGGGLRLRLTPE